MPTLYTALRTHLPKPKARRQQPTSFGLAMMVSAPKRKKPRERIYRLSLAQRFENIFERPERRGTRKAHQQPALRLRLLSPPDPDVRQRRAGHREIGV